MRKLPNPVGLGFLQTEAATAPGGLHTPPTVPLTSVAGVAMSCLTTTSASCSVCRVGVDSHAFFWLRREGWESDVRKNE